jgi:hypothetical protein
MRKILEGHGRGTKPRYREQSEYEEADVYNGGAPGDRLANALGWFSLGLGALETAAPGAMGIREITAGIGILTKEQPSRWMWARVVGDVMDLGMLGAAVPTSQRRDRVAFSAALVGGILALDVVCARQLR